MLSSNCSLNFFVTELFQLTVSIKYFAHYIGNLGTVLCKSELNGKTVQLGDTAVCKMLAK